jgi:hypothetical protein
MFYAKGIILNYQYRYFIVGIVGGVWVVGSKKYKGPKQDSQNCLRSHNSERGKPTVFISRNLMYFSS